MNDTNVATGAYIGTKMHTSGLNSAKTTINTAFGSAHILNHRQFFSNAVTSEYESARAWYDSTVDLMNEQMVYGGKVFSNIINGNALPHIYTIDKSQLPLFALAPEFITIRVRWWLRDVVSSNRFADVRFDGIADTDYAGSSLGVRPAFGIC